MNTSLFSNLVPYAGGQQNYSQDSTVNGYGVTYYDGHCIQDTMFIPYDTHNPNIIPNNTVITPPPPPPPIPYLIDQPYLIYDKNNEFVGFSWNYGQSINLCFTYSQAFPMVLPNGRPISFGDYIRDKAIKVTIYNFRMEEVTSVTTGAKEDLKSIFIRIDSDLSLKMVRGLYYLQAEVYTEDEEETSKTDDDDDAIYAETPEPWPEPWPDYQPEKKQKIILISPEDLYLQVI